MEWISVKDRLPEKDFKVLCFYSNQYIDVLEYWYDEKEIPVFFNPPLHSVNDVTHWMPLPEPPKEL
jgi:hypothetical protein